MKNTLKILFLFFVLISVLTPRSEANLPTFDAVNAMLNEINNALMQSQFAQDIALALERLQELRAQTQELFRFHAGIDEILDAFVGDPFKDFRDGRIVRDTFVDLGLITPDIEILDGRGTPADIQATLRAMTGVIPNTEAKPYLVFEEMQVVEAFHLASQIRESGHVTREAAEKIANESVSASPKGAARLQAQGVSQLMSLEQQNLEASAKLLELQATQVQQITREEKRLEQERVKFLEDSQEFGDLVISFFKGSSLS